MNWIWWILLKLYLNKTNVDLIYMESIQTFISENIQQNNYYILSEYTYTIISLLGKGNSKPRSDLFEFCPFLS